MKIASIAVIALLALGLSACGDDTKSEDAGSGPATQASAPDNFCADHVGEPLASVLGEDETGQTVECSPKSDKEGFASMFNGCYDDDLQLVEGVTVVSWLADGGSYYGRTDGDLKFAEGQKSITEMADAVGC